MALYGKMASVTYQDYPEASRHHSLGRQSVGHRASTCSVSSAKRRSVAPSWSSSIRGRRRWRESADIHLAVRPGTDVAVALAIHRYLFANGFADEAFLQAHTRGADRLRERAEPWTIERAAGVAGVEPAALEQVARLYAERSPALIRCGWGLERNRNGGNAAMAVLSLPAVGGKFGVRGGGYTMSNSASWNIDRSWIGAEEPGTRLVNMNHLGRALTEYRDPPVDVLFVYNCNPVATVPDQHRIVRGTGARGPVHGRLRAGDDRHRALRRRGAPEHDVPRGVRLRQGLRASSHGAGAPHRGRRRRVAVERGRVRRALAAGSACSRRASRPASSICS